MFKVCYISDFKKLNNLTSFILEMMSIVLFEEKKVVLQIDGKRKSIAATQYIIDRISTKVLSDIHVTTCNGVIIDIYDTNKTSAGTHL